MADIETPYSKPIDLSKATVLITGGTGGIGFGFVKLFVAAGSKVIVCGRRQEALDEVKRQYSDVLTVQADVGKAEDRVKLNNYVIEHAPAVNVLINNAGIQRRGGLVEDVNADWVAEQQQIDINCGAPVHLTTLFAKHFLQQPEAAIINITSGLAFIPPAFAPVYGASKAFLHSYTMSSRYAFKDSNVQVVEIAPPAVKSNLGGSHDFGEPTDEFCSAVFDLFRKGHKEIGYKMSEEGRLASREEINKRFEAMAKFLHAPTFEAKQ